MRRLTRRRARVADGAAVLDVAREVEAARGAVASGEVVALDAAVDASAVRARRVTVVEVLASLRAAGLRGGDTVGARRRVASLAAVRATAGSADRDTVGGRGRGLALTDDGWQRCSMSARNRSHAPVKDAVAHRYRNGWSRRRGPAGSRGRSSPGCRHPHPTTTRPRRTWRRHGEPGDGPRGQRGSAA